MTHRFSYVKNPLVLAVVLVALLLVPTPLLPPHRLAEFVRRTSGVGWKAAYLASAVGLSGLFYFALGATTVLAVGRAKTRRNRLLQILLLPLVVSGLALVVRWTRLGYVPIFANVVVSLVACLLGVWLGLALLSRRVVGNLIGFGLALSVTLWSLNANASPELASVTEWKLKRIGDAGPGSPGNADRYGAILRVAFESVGQDPVLDNRAAILAVGIAVGHDRLAKFVGLDRDSDVVRAAQNAAREASMRGRQDWAKHFSVSAALAVLESPWVSDAGGLVKEELDAHARGSGFSFGDLAADRAGVRFAEAATRSDESARAVQKRLAAGFAVDDYLPAVEDLPEGLSREQFQARFGGAGSPAYRNLVGEIDGRLAECPGLK